MTSRSRAVLNRGRDEAANDPRGVTDILDHLDELASNRDKVSLGDVVKALGHRSYGPFLIIPPLIDISPIGAVPGLPTAIAVLIILTRGSCFLGTNICGFPALSKGVPYPPPRWRTRPGICGPRGSGWIAGSTDDCRY